jgi:hypothetical protein
MLQNLLVIPVGPSLGRATVDDTVLPLVNWATLFIEPFEVERARGFRGIFLIK